MKTKTYSQVAKQMTATIRLIASNPKHKHAKYKKILKHIPIDVHQRWTEKQNKRFVTLLQLYGNEYNKIGKHFPTFR